MSGPVINWGTEVGDHRKDVVKTVKNSGKVVQKQWES